MSCPSFGMSWTTLAPRSRNGVSGDQKGPRIAEEVAESPFSVTIVWLISSTRLEKLLAGIQILIAMVDHAFAKARVN